MGPLSSYLPPFLSQVNAELYKERNSTDVVFNKSFMGLSSIKKKKKNISEYNCYLKLFCPRTGAIREKNINRMQQHRQNLKRKYRWISETIGKFLMRCFGTTSVSCIVFYRKASKRNIGMFRYVTTEPEARSVDKKAFSNIFRKLPIRAGWINAILGCC